MKVNSQDFFKPLNVGIAAGFCDQPPVVERGENLLAVFQGDLHQTISAEVLEGSWAPASNGHDFLFLANKVTKGNKAVVFGQGLGFTREAVDQGGLDVSATRRHDPAGPDCPILHVLIEERFSVSALTFLFHRSHLLCDPHENLLDGGLIVFEVLFSQNVLGNDAKGKGVEVDKH